MATEKENTQVPETETVQDTEQPTADKNEQQTSKENATPQSAGKNSSKAPAQKVPEWLHSIGDFFKMIFLSPIALFHQLIIRLTEGKEGVKKARERAEYDEKLHDELSGLEGQAKQRTEKVCELLKDIDNSKYGDLAVADFEQYVGKHGEKNLIVNVQLANGTTHHMTVTPDDVLYADATVPPEVTEQVQALLAMTKEHMVMPNEQQGNVTPDEPMTSQEEPEQPVAESENDAQTPVPKEPAEPESVRIAVKQEDNTFTCDFKGRQLQLVKDSNGRGEITYGDMTFTTSWNAAMQSVMVVPQSNISYNDLDAAMIFHAAQAAYAEELRGAQALENGPQAVNPVGALCKGISAVPCEKYVSGTLFFTNKDTWAEVRSGKTGNHSYIHLGQIGFQDGKYVRSDIGTDSPDGHQKVSGLRIDNKQYNPDAVTRELITSYANVLGQSTFEQTFPNGVLNCGGVLYKPLCDENGKYVDTAGLGTIVREPNPQPEAIMSFSDKASVPDAVLCGFGLSTSNIQNADVLFSDIAQRASKFGYSRVSAQIGDTCFRFTQTESGLQATAYTSRLHSGEVQCGPEHTRIVGPDEGLSTVIKELYSDVQEEKAVAAREGDLDEFEIDE